MKVREARGEDKGKGECRERPRQQEESQVRCHTQIEQSEPFRKITFCDMPQACRATARGR
jgi:hypothetical protein